MRKIDHLLKEIYTKLAILQLLVHHRHILILRPYCAFLVLSFHYVFPLLLISSAVRLSCTSFNRKTGNKIFAGICFKESGF